MNWDIGLTECWNYIKKKQVYVCLNEWNSDRKGVSNFSFCQDKGWRVENECSRWRGLPGFTFDEAINVKQFMNSFRSRDETSTESGLVVWIVQIVQEKAWSLSDNVKRYAVKSCPNWGVMRPPRMKTAKAPKPTRSRRGGLKCRAPSNNSPDCSMGKRLTLVVFKKKQRLWSVV